MRKSRRGRGGRVRRVGPRPFDTMRVRIFLFIRVRASHALGDCIRRERWKTAAAMARAENVAARAVVVAKMLIPLYLRGRRRKKIDIHAGRCPVVVAGVRGHARPHMAGMVGVRVWGRDIWRANLRDRRRPGHGLAWRRHHGSVVVHHRTVLAGDCGRGGEMLGLVVPS